MAYTLNIPEDFMISVADTIKWVALLVCLLAALSAVGCSGSETREKVDDVVEEMTGKKDVDRMQHMKKNIDQIEQNQAERYKQLDPEGAEDPEEE